MAVRCRADIHGYSKMAFVHYGLVLPPILFFFFFGLFSRATPAAYGGSQARGQIAPVAAGLHHSHRNARSEPCLRPTPQLMAMPDP